MKETLRRDIGLSLDMDGVTMSRFPFQYKAVRDLILKGKRAFDPPSSIPDIQRTIQYKSKMSLGEEISYRAHEKRKLKNGAKEFIEEAFEEATIYGNTGRAAKRKFVDATEISLQNVDVLKYFRGIYYKPEKMWAVKSKAEAIKRLKKVHKLVIHVDDDPQTVFALAQLFPDVQFIIMQDLSTGILYSFAESKKYKNVKRVASFKEINLKQMAREANIV